MTTFARTRGVALFTSLVAVVAGTSCGSRDERSLAEHSKGLSGDLVTSRVDQIRTEFLIHRSDGAQIATIVPASMDLEAAHQVIEARPRAAPSGVEPA